MTSTTQEPRPFTQNLNLKFLWLLAKTYIIIGRLLNVFTAKGRKDNYFNSALQNLKKSAVEKFKTKRQVKKELIEYVRYLQRGPKKSNWEIYQLCRRKGMKVDEEGNVYHLGIFGNLKSAGVKVDWQKMKFIN